MMRQYSAEFFFCFFQSPVYTESIQFISHGVILHCFQLIPFNFIPFHPTPFHSVPSIQVHVSCFFFFSETSPVIFSTELAGCLSAYCGCVHLYSQKKEGGEAGGVLYMLPAKSCYCGDTLRSYLIGQKRNSLAAKATHVRIIIRDVRLLDSRSSL